MDPWEVEVDNVMIKKCYELHIGAHWPALNRQLLLNTMLKELPRVSLNGHIFADADLADEFKEVLQHHYVPFLHKFFDWVFCAGFAVVRVCTLPDGQRAFCAYGIEEIGKTYRVYMRTDYRTHRRKFRVIRNVDNKGMPCPPKVDRKAVVLANLGHDPTFKGEIRSRFRSLLDILDYNQYTIRLGVIAEYNLAMPTLVTTAKDVHTALEQMPESQISVYAEYDALRAPNEGLFRHDARDRGSVRKNAVSKDFKPPDVHAEDALRLRNQFQGNVFNLPPGREVSNQPLPQRQPDFVGLQTWFEHAVSATYGVPRELIAKDVSLRTAASADLIRDQMRDTLSYWIKLFSHILTKMHNLAVNEDECIWWAATIKEKMNSDDLIKKVRKNTNWEISLPMPPNADAEFMHYLYAMGITPFPEFHDHMRATAGLPPAAAPKPPTFDTEMPTVLPTPPQRK